MSVKNEVLDGTKEVSKFARLVVAKRVAIVATITIVLNLAVSNGWITPDLSHHALSVLTSILDGVAAIAAIVIIHPAVTPLVDPRDNMGVPLVPQTVAVSAVDAAQEVLTVDEDAAPEPDADVVANPGTQTPETNKMNDRPLPFPHAD